MDPLLILEWSGSLTGLVGAFLLATNTRVSRYGWIAFLIANFLMIAFAIGIGKYGLMVQQIGFTFTSLLGIYRSGLIAPSWCAFARKAQA